MKHLNVFNSVSEYNNKKDYLQKPYVTYIAENKGIDMNDNVKRVAINNQDKSVDITENGSIELFADSDYTGLGKVIVNTNVASGGGGGSDMPVIGDGKTYLYIKIASKGRMNVPLYFSQTVAKGVTIDWGDGSAPQTLSGTGDQNTTHRYSDIGEYTISLNPADGCTLGLGRPDDSYCVMGSANTNVVYCNMLQAVEIGKNVIFKYAFSACYSLASVVISNSVTSIDANAFSKCYSLKNIIIPNSVTSIDNGAFRECYSLKNIVIPDSVTSIGTSAFSACYSLASVVIPNSVTSIDNSAFYACRALTSVVIPNSVISINDNTFGSCYSLANIVIPDSVTSIGTSAFSACYSLASVVIPNSVTSIDNSAFSECKGMAFYDFSQCTSVPTLGGTSVFSYISSDCKIVVPDALYESWKAATNWSTHASKMVKASEFNA
jgi:hypothetical protein